LFEERALAVGVPLASVGTREEGAKPVRGRGLAPDGRDADDAVLIRELVQRVRLLVRPAVAKETRHGNLERLGGVRHLTLEEPLGGVLGVRFGKAVGVLFLGNLGPVSEIEWDL